MSEMGFENVFYLENFECAGDEVLVESSPPASPDMAARLAAPAQVSILYYCLVVRRRRLRVYNGERAAAFSVLLLPTYCDQLTRLPSVVLNGLILQLGEAFSPAVECNRLLMMNYRFMEADWIGAGAGGASPNVRELIVIPELPNTIHLQHAIQQVSSTVVEVNGDSSGHSSPTAEAQHTYIVTSTDDHALEQDLKHNIKSEA
ncbi:jg21732 [Pararge aegeria aegeria]|uniref:Jg21732 protein n=1 Tax=Pararge aegeria aegeria TaxID=348720 RepID=A0A8S4S4V9_9NEOP|nr:jg21732 [Pararge aegeria aegeria]